MVRLHALQRWVGGEKLAAQLAEGSGSGTRGVLARLGATDAGTARRNRASDMGCLRRGGGRDRGDACALLLAVRRG